MNSAVHKGYGLVSRYGVTDKEAVVVILPELLVTKYDKPFHVLQLEEDTENTKVLVSVMFAMFNFKSLCAAHLIYTLWEPAKIVLIIDLPFANLNVTKAV